VPPAFKVRASVPIFRNRILSPPPPPPLRLLVPEHLLRISLCSAGRIIPASPYFLPTFAKPPVNASPSGFLSSIVTHPHHQNTPPPPFTRPTVSSLPSPTDGHRCRVFSTFVGVWFCPLNPMRFLREHSPPVSFLELYVNLLWPFFLQCKTALPSGSASNAAVLSWPSGVCTFLVLFSALVVGVCFAVSRGIPPALPSHVFQLGALPFSFGPEHLPPLGLLLPGRRWWFYFPVCSTCLRSFLFGQA